MAPTDQVYVDIATPTTGAKLLVDVPKMTLEWSHIMKTVQVKPPGSKSTVDKVVLNDVNGSATAGEFVVLMGPSGAGKSSLLDVISGRQNPTSGSVLVNGQRWSKATAKRASYVMQDDVFYETLTVEEHLLFQAELRMGKLFDENQRRARVDFVIQELGLGKTRNAQIGGDKIRGISGGERKRLSFATEILTNPSLLFADEPTSGLDSVMAESVIQQLRQLAQEGRTVIATIHQPSSELFPLFDKLYLLSEGQTVYNGKAEDAVQYFASQGYACPSYMNPTDYFMRQIIMADGAAESTTRVQGLVKAWKVTEQQALEAASASSSTEADDATYEETHMGVTGQLRVLTKRNITRLVRDKIAFGARMGQSIFTSIFAGLIFWQIKVSQTGIQSYNGAVFFVAINQMFGAATPEFIAVPMELPIMRREYDSGLYHAWVWYLAKNVSELFFQILFPLVFLVPLYFMIGFGASDAELFFTFLLFIVLITSAATALGYMVSCVAKNADVANILGILILLPSVIFGGLFLNPDDIPVYFKWCAFLTPLKYGFRGMERAFWSTVDVIPCAAGQTCTARSGQEVLESLGLAEHDLVYDVVFILWINIAYRLVGLAALYAKVYKRA
ncbi:ATP-binding Cassette (ABC) Superfamily [Achlya hypogyna]|uniref:ATP-binding Cassette (ABC) Superfamily n=1 Tax=Achlya hypogyna TaxID=1202772 RepID=A0A1V9YTP7_ACHHY|nr:ATP-binding Cassette (ABC) Superfamily [Achlya hypogyna]